MKKYILIGVLFFITANIIAQNEKFIGSWQENYHLRKDTLDTGYNEIKKNYRAYRSGFLKLSLDYVMYMEVYPENDRKWEITIIKEDNTFWITKEDGLKEKLMYNSKANNYYVFLKDWWEVRGNLIIEYQPKTKEIVLLEEDTKMIVFVFSRK
jgi:hypothetical protein